MPANVGVQQPQNPALQAQLQQAMINQGANSGLTFDDLANFVITQGRSNVCYRSTNDSEVLQKYFTKR